MIKSAILSKYPSFFQLIKKKAAKNQITIAAVAYSTVYPVTMFLRVLTAQLLILIFAYITRTLHDRWRGGFTDKAL